MWEGTRLLATQTLARPFADPHVVTSPARDGVVGRLYSPGDGQPHPAVLVIGGSDGGFGVPDVAMLLASHGYTTLSIAYFGEPGLPPSLEQIPMEDFTRALDWLRRQPTVDPRFVAIYGESRGSEPALWTAAHTRGVNAVVARSPSDVLWGGVTANHLPGKATWTQAGKPLPYIANHIPIGLGVGFLWNLAMRAPTSQTPMFVQNLKDFGDTASVEIPVERIQGPILLLAGRDDQIWPSALMAEHLLARLRRNHHPYPDELLAYHDVGHPIPYAYLPLAGDRRHSRFAVGGSVHGYANALQDAWPKVLAFLDRASASTTSRVGGLGRSAARS